MRNELDRHFNEEEQGGCIEEAVCRCPSLSQDATRVEQQHPGLLEQLDNIISRTRTVPCVIADIEHDVADFASQLMAHEAAESRILQRAFGSNSD